MTDFLMLEKLHKMIKNVKRPRLMFRKGIAAEGFFRPYMSFEDYTEAELFRSIDIITPVKVRFSALLGDEGTADTVRNFKSMNIRFDVEGEPYDMFCSSIPVFLINSEGKFFSMAEAFTVKRPFDSINNSSFWKFVTENTESVNCAVRLFSHEGLLSSYIDAKWFSVTPAVWINSCGRRFLTRYKWIPMSEEGKPLDRISAEFLAGFDSNHALNQLKREIDSGRFPCYELRIQIADSHSTGISPYTQRTRIWDEDDIPDVPAGIMKLTGLSHGGGNDEDSLNFIPSNTVKGIELFEDDFSQAVNYMYRVEALERGE